MSRVLSILACLCLMFPLMSFAEDRIFLVHWEHPSTGPEPSRYTVAWGKAPGPPYPNHLSVIYPNNSVEFGLTGLAPGETIYISALSCDINAECSAWTTEQAHVVIADGLRNPPREPENIQVGVMQ